MRYINYRKLKTFINSMLQHTNILTATARLNGNSVFAGCVCGVAGGKGQSESDPRTTRMR